VLLSGLLKKPILVEVDPDGNAYVLDLDDCRIRVSARSGKLLAQIGAGRGSIEGAFVSPTGLALGADRHVWICDPVTEKVAEFLPDGKLLREFKPRTKPFKLAVLANRVLIMAVPMRSYLFELYATDGTWQRSFGKWIDHQDSLGICLDGMITQSPSHGFVYAGVAAGLLAAYSGDGEAVFARQTVLPLGLPPVLRENGCQRRQPGRPRAATGVGTSNDGILVVKDRTVDAYRPSDGTYQWSFGLPSTCGAVAFHEDLVYCVTANRVEIWRRASL
jgi:hypothetical protein